MNLYVWEKDVLFDYSDGLICVHANSLDQAREIVREEMGEGSAHFKDIQEREPDRVIFGKGWAWCYGSS